MESRKSEEARRDSASIGDDERHLSGKRVLDGGQSIGEESMLY